MNIIFPGTHYDDALRAAGLNKLEVGLRREGHASLSSWPWRTHSINCTTCFRRSECPTAQRSLDRNTMCHCTTQLALGELESHTVSRTGTANSYPRTPYLQTFYNYVLRPYVCSLYFLVSHSVLVCIKCLLCVLFSQMVAKPKK